MSMFDVFNRKQSAEDLLANDSASFGDIDMLISERDGSLVPVAMENGVHVCQQCREQFVDDPGSPLRMAEFNCGGEGIRIGIHSKCVRKAQKALNKRGDRGAGAGLVLDMSEKHKARRFFYSGTKPFNKGDTG